MPHLNWDQPCLSADLLRATKFRYCPLQVSSAIFIELSQAGHDCVGQTPFGHVRFHVVLPSYRDRENIVRRGKRSEL